MAHQHTKDIDFGAHADHLESSGNMWSSVVATIAAELPLPSGGDRADGPVVADVGCGTGEMSLLLAARVEPAGRVYAVDREDTLLDRVRQRAGAAGLGDRITTVNGDLTGLAGVLPEPADLVWAGHVLHHAGDQAAALAKLVAALAPGGVLAVAEGGLPPRYLPWEVGVGRPGLEARLEAAHDGWFGAMRAGLPGTVGDPRGWSALLAGAGLVEVTARGYLLHRPPPLDPDRRAAIAAGLAGKVERSEPWLDGEDLAAWRRLLDRDDPAWLGNRDDLDIRAMDTVYLGRRAA